MKTDIRKIIVPDFMIVLNTFKNNEILTSTDIQKETNITYSHIHGIKKVFINKGWITTKKNKVEDFITITPKGKVLVDLVVEWFKQLGINKDNVNEFRNKTKTKKFKEEVVKDDNSN